MTGLSDYAESQMLGILHGTNVTAPTLYLQLHTGPPGDAGTANVATDTSRKQIHFGSPSGTAPTQVASDGTTTNNGTAITWSAYSGPSFPSVDIVTHYTLWDSITPGAGNCWASGPLGGFTPFEALAEASSNLISTIAAHGLSAGDYINPETYVGLSLPAGIVANTTYYVIASGLTPTACKISATVGGAELNITGDGALIVQKIAGKYVNNGDPVSVANGEIIVYLD